MVVAASGAVDQRRARELAEDQHCRVVHEIAAGRVGGAAQVGDEIGERVEAVFSIPY